MEGADRAALVGEPSDNSFRRVGKRPFPKILYFFTFLFIYITSVQKIFQLKMPYLYTVVGLSLKKSEGAIAPASPMAADGD